MASLSYGESSSAANPVLDVYVRDGSGALIDPAALEFVVYDYTTASEVQVHPSSGRQAITIADVPTGQRLSTGRFYAAWTVISGANVGTYRIRWWATDADGLVSSFTEEFEVLAVAVPGVSTPGVSAPTLAAFGLDVLATETATRIRRTGTWTGGVFGETARSTTTLACSAQPARGRDLEQLPEAKRSMGAFITRTNIRTADESGQMADLITYDGSNYEVAHAEQWPPGSGVFTKAIAVRVEA